MQEVLLEKLRNCGVLLAMSQGESVTDPFAWCRQQQRTLHQKIHKKISEANAQPHQVTSLSVHKKLKASTSVKSLQLGKLVL